MEIPEIIDVFDKKITELQKFFDLAADPEQTYPDSFRFVSALQEAIYFLQEKPTILEKRVEQDPFGGFTCQVLMEWHGNKLKIDVPMRVEELV